MKDVVAIALLASALPFTAAAQLPEPPSVTGRPPAIVELDNASVEVLRIRLGPHERTPVHDVTPRVIVWTTAAHLRLTFPSGETHTEDHKAGDVTWVPAQRHSGENLSDAPIEFVAILPKSTAQH